MSLDVDGDRARQLPACQRCRTRKIKCDRGAPKCSRCVKSKTTCLIVDPVTSETYSRDYITLLEERERELRAEVEASATPNLTEGTHNDAATDSLTSPASASRLNAFVGDGSGLGLMRSIFSDQRWQAYEPQLLEQLAERPQIPEMKATQNPQPPIEEASNLLENYFGRFHINHTFLMRRDIMATFNRVYQPSSIQSPSPQDYFRLFMVFAISAVTRFRASVSNEHPYGYYLAAQNYLSNISLVGSLDAIQNLLLIARFGMYHHIGMSLWDISRFCMRQCVEQNLHIGCQEEPNLLREQHGRRVFWECYILDRYSSGVLGRPFAIADQDITAGLPINAPDEIIEARNFSRLDDILSNADPSTTELSAFIFVIDLRRITSRIHTEFYNCRNVGNAEGGNAAGSQQLSSGDVYVKLHRFMNELDHWRERAPQFPEQRSLYERPEWYDFMTAKEKLLLARAAMHLAPRRNGHPPHDLLCMSLKYATEIIQLYDRMFEIKCITWTRSYFQVIFAAGLSIIYCISLGVYGDADPPVNNLGTGSSAHGVTLGVCSKILQMFKREMPDAGRFAIVFEMLRNNVSRDSSMAQSPHHDRESLDNHIEQATMSALDRLQEHSSLEKNNTGIDVLADIASWPGGMDALSALNTNASNAMPPPNNFYGPTSDIAQSTAGQETMLEWPALTDEMMEQLETGLGEYAWDMVGSNANMWDTSMEWGN